ncbi:MAG TPA: hypothetical protein VE547_07450 [Mycobacteriales bacterium]|nr:hypothetical protein [Mycobacteriales bacterium]
MREPDRWTGGSRAADAALLLAVLIAGSVSRHAVYNPVGIVILVLAVAGLGAAVWSGAGRGGPSRAGVLLALAGALVAQVLKPPYMNVDHRTWALRAGVYVAMAVTVLAVVPLLRRSPAVAAVAVGATGVAYGLVIAGGQPLIDVWPILQGATRGVVEGRNPYGMTFTGVPPGQVNDCFNYLPGTFLVPLPGRLLAGDVRYAEAAVLLAGVAALAWYAVRRRSGTATALAVLAGVLPGSLYDVQQAWNETVVFGGLAAAAVLVAVRRPWWAAAALVVALATKQHVVLLLPLWALWPAFGPRRALAAAAGAGAVTLPWFLADPGRFWHCVVDFFVDLPAREDSLSVWQLLPGPLRAVTVLALVAAAYVLAVRGLPRTPGGLLLGCGLVLAAFALANKQSFLNQWLLAAQLVVAGLTLVAAASRPVREVSLPAAATPS